MRDHAASERFYCGTSCHDTVSPSCVNGSEGHSYGAIYGRVFVRNNPLCSECGTATHPQLSL